MHGSETWALGKAEQNLQERTKIRTLRWMNGLGIKKQDRGQVWQTYRVSEKIREARLRWLLGNVERKTEEDVVMRTWKWVDTER